ncbi:MAG: hypothetical protein F6J93_31415 [Oscillatoria sp. SIO1A7]|nr:hypothetical protein [Oscillatoria sp. SIO1A7]
MSIERSALSSQLSALSSQRSALSGQLLAVSSQRSAFSGRCGARSVRSAVGESAKRDWRRSRARR